MADVKLKDIDGVETSYTGINQISIPRATGSGDQLFIDPANLTPQLLASLDADFVAGNIKKDVDLFGLIGSLEGGGGEVEIKHGSITFAEAVTGNIPLFSVADKTGADRIPDLLIVFYYPGRVIKTSITRRIFDAWFKYRESTTYVSCRNVAINASEHPYDGEDFPSISDAVVSGVLQYPYARGVSWVYDAGSTWYYLAVYGEGDMR